MTEFDETFDWVVVGSGAGSMSSALMMRKAGKSVVILEKQVRRRHNRQVGRGAREYDNGWAIPITARTLRRAGSTQRPTTPSISSQAMSAPMVAR